MRATGQRTRFVVPAGSARGRHPLARGRSRTTPSTPRAALALVRRDPLGAVRRSARSLKTHPPVTRGGAVVPGRRVAMRWAVTRRGLRDPRAPRSLPWPG
jgi:hypothetical protein